MIDNEYRRQHKCCPKCGSKSLEVTCVGYLDIDMNRARCGCGWVGIVHDLVPFKSKKIASWEYLQLLYKDYYKDYELGKRYSFAPEIKNGIIQSIAIEDCNGEFVKVNDVINAINAIFEVEHIHE